MSILEIRRHSIRKAGAGSQLSQEGVDLARTVGAALGPFTLVVTSVSPRARETAIAMGFAVEEAHPFEALARAIAPDNSYSRHANAIAGIWRDLLTPLGDGDSALIIGHSGEIEPALVACFPDADHGSWGPSFGPCEGARIQFEGELPHFTNVEILRAPTGDNKEPVESDDERLLCL